MPVSATIVKAKINFFGPSLLYLSANVRCRALALDVIFTYLVTRLGPFGLRHRQFSRPIGGGDPRAAPGRRLGA
jgi:hypothetical protein